MEEEKKEKRKTHTSSEVKMRYNKKTYTRIGFDLRNDVADAYKAKCRELGIPYTKPLHDAVEAFLKEDK